MPRQYEVITDLQRFIHNQPGVLFVTHKAITVRTSKISSWLPHISSCTIRSQQVFRGMEQRSQQRGNAFKVTKSFGARRSRYKTDKIAFLNLKTFILVKINGFQTRASVVCLHVLDPLCETGSAANGCLCLTTGYAFK